jgi:hypothetical protein
MALFNFNFTALLKTGQSFTGLKYNKLVKTGKIVMKVTLEVLSY